MPEKSIINSFMDLFKDLEYDVRNHNEQSLINKYENGIKLLLPSPKKIGGPIAFYRARPAETVTAEQSITAIETFSYMPLRYNSLIPPKPARGRMNLTGQSIFYASSLPQTNFKEIKKDIKEGDEVYLSKWELKPDSVMNTYSVVISNKISETANSDIEVCITDPYIVNGPIGEYLRYFSDTLLKNEDDEDKKYLLTSLISHHIFNINGQYKKENELFPLHYDAIAYPSVQSKNGEYNWAIKPNFVDKHILLKYVVKGVLKADLQSVDFGSIGFNHNNKILWYNLKVFPSDTKFDSYCIWDIKGYKYTSFDYNLRDASGKEVSINGIKKIFEERKNEIVEALTNQGAFIERMNYEDVVNESSLIKSGVYPLWIPVSGWSIEIEGKQIEIANIGALLLYKTGLEKITN